MVMIRKILGLIVILFFLICGFANFNGTYKNRGVNNHYSKNSWPDSLQYTIQKDSSGRVVKLEITTNSDIVTESHNWDYRSNISRSIYFDKNGIAEKTIVTSDSTTVLGFFNDGLTVVTHHGINNYSGVVDTIREINPTLWQTKTYNTNGDLIVSGYKKDCTKTIRNSAGPIISYSDVCKDSIWHFYKNGELIRTENYDNSRKM